MLKGVLAWGSIIAVLVPCVVTVSFGVENPACGDGVVANTESCDDGNVGNGDGCSSVCAIEPGYQCVGQPSVCTPIASAERKTAGVENPACGDGVVANTESCDDGNVGNGDGCSSVCAIEPGYQCVGQPSVCTPVASEHKTITSLILPSLNLSPRINIIWISARSASPQNSNHVTLSFNVTNLLSHSHGICGLNASNLKLAILNAPPHASSLAITGLAQLDDSLIAHSCFYNITIAPTAILGIKPKWVAGTYNVRLDYVQSGNVKANKNFSFTVLPHFILPY